VVQLLAARDQAIPPEHWKLVVNKAAYTQVAIKCLYSYFDFLKNAYRIKVVGKYSRNHKIFV
jgi:hypothetical protein